MKYSSLVSATLILAAVAFLALEIMTGKVHYWMLGMGFFAAVAFRLFDLENRNAAEEDTVAKVFKH